MSILLARHINTVLSASPVIKAAVKDRIYRNGIDTEVPFPFIVYTYRVQSTEGTKDGDIGDDCSVDVMVFTRDGTQEIQLSEAIRAAVARSGRDYVEFSVDDIDFVSYDSEFGDGVYTGILRFNVKTY